MKIEFRGSPRPTLGIEVEAIVVGADRALANVASTILPELPGADAEGNHPKVKHELFECTLEAITGVCTTVAEARDDLAATLRDVVAILARHDLALCCAGTHPFTHWRDLEISPKDRYRSLVDRLQWTARRLSIYGIHYHVGVPSAAAAVAVTNSLAHHLPLFLALSASSPYWHGMDTGMASCRTKVFESLPTAGLPPHLDDWADFEGFMSTLVNAGAIESIREVWWDVRPHPDFGTVELRICDGMPTLTEVAAGAALAQCLVVWMLDELAAGRPLPGSREWTLRQNKWLAARHGVDAEIIVDDSGRRRPVVEVLGDLVDRLAPVAARLGCEAELAGIPALLAAPSYRRQRAVFARTGDHGAVVDLLVQELAADLAIGTPDDRRPAPAGAPAAPAVFATDRAAAGEWSDALDALDGFCAHHREELVALRRHLHAHPERSGEERATTEAVAERLRVAGLAPVVLPAGAGLWCDVGTDGPLIALRADLDALAMDDEKDVPYRSQVPGLAHACGHDVHTTTVLGAGLALAAQADSLPGRVRLLFEPAEETVPGGALDLIAAGALDGVQMVFGMHCEPKLATGVVGVRTGAITSAADLLEIRLAGPGGHTARPHLTVDLVAIAGRVAAELPGRVGDASGGALLLVFGAIDAGDAANVIPTHARLRGSLRTPDRDAWADAPALLRAELASILAGTDAVWEIGHVPGVPPVVNDVAATELLAAAARDVVGSDGVVTAPQSAGGDSFAWYGERAPVSYARLGTHDPGRDDHLDLHAGTFDVDERAIEIGVRVLAGAALRALRDLASG